MVKVHVKFIAASFEILYSVFCFLSLYFFLSVSVAIQLTVHMTHIVSSAEDVK